VQQFIAILKDSFREAVDGFVIYLMLGLSSLLILLIASISYTPDPPAEALPQVLPKFAIIFPDRGTSNAPTGVPVFTRYEAAEPVENGDGSVSFTLEIGPEKPKVEGKEEDKEKTEKKPEEKKPEVKPDLRNDGFRYAVFAWTKPPGPKIDNPLAERRRNPNAKNQLEIVTPPLASETDLREVTEEQMIAFLKNQFVMFAGVNESDVTLTRKPGVAEPEYKFDVRLRSVSGAKGWPHGIKVFFGATRPLKGIPLGTTLYFLQDFIVNGLGAAVTLIISVVITAFFIPNMLRKGSIDLLISKPIGRVQLLVYKYIGGLTFIFLLSSFTIGGVWLVMALRSGSWDPTFLLVIPVLTFTFAILYSVSTVVAVYTRSAIAAILVSIGFMFAMYLIGQAKSFFDANKVLNQFDLPEWSYTLVDTLNNILPRYKDLDKLTTKFIVDGVMPVGDARLNGLLVEYPSWSGAVGVSLIFIAIMLTLASLRLVKRDN
jgi:ABC-type transport system involved in multi-copper enzyme maturation permease subunit